MSNLIRECKVYADSLLDFTSNDYLSLASHSEVKKAFIQGVEKYGLGSGSSPQVSGYSAAHQALEEAFAEFLQREKAILFNSGYHANIGVIPAFTNRSSTIYANKLCHASLIDGILLSKAKHLRYHLPRTDIAASMIVTESVFSMEGNITDIQLLSKIAKENNALLYVDDAHAIGILGKQGRGIIEYTGINNEIDCLITPLGKAPGSMGAIVSGSNEIINKILQSARTHRYSTAIPAANCVGTLKALELLQKENERREKLSALIQFFIREADKRNFALSSRDLTPIKSILIGSNELVMSLQKNLLEKNILIAAIRPPTVPVNSARIRVSLNYQHSEKDILYLLNSLEAFFASKDFSRTQS